MKPNFKEWLLFDGSLADFHQWHRPEIYEAFEDDNNADDYSKALEEAWHELYNIEDGDVCKRLKRILRYKAKLDSDGRLYQL